MRNLSDAKPGYHTIGGKTIHTDSNMEAQIIRGLEKNGFHNKWDRPGYGITFNDYNYTPDVELSVQQGKLTYRAWVEFKPVSKTQFTYDARRRMCGASKHYPSIVLLLYVHRARQWYLIDRQTGEDAECSQPLPGKLNINKLYSPFALPSQNFYGHNYRQAFNPFFKLIDSVADSLLMLIDDLTSGPKPRRRRRRAH